MPYCLRNPNLIRSIINSLTVECAWLYKSSIYIYRKKDRFCFCCLVECLFKPTVFLSTKPHSSTCQINNFTNPAVFNLCYAVIKSSHFFSLVRMASLVLFIIPLTLFKLFQIVISRLSIAALYNYHQAVGQGAHPV